MAERQLFHIRKALNTLQRSTLSTQSHRLYSSTTTTNDTTNDTIPTPIDTTSFVQTPQQARSHAEKLLVLRALDQKLLQDTSDQCSTLISHIRKTTSALADIPFTIPQRKGDTVTYPTYTISALRQRVSLADTAAQAVINATEHVQSHLADLQKEDIYTRKASQSNSELSTSAEWEREIVSWSEEERKKELESMQIEEVAELTRLTSSVEGLERKMREMESMSGKGAENVRTASPFTAREKGKGVEKDAKEGKEEKETGWGDGKAAVRGAKEAAVESVSSSSPSAAKDREKVVGKEAKDGKASGWGGKKAKVGRAVKEESKEAQAAVEEKKPPPPPSGLAERMARMQGKA